ncbi:MAG: exodeoxyribonuclease III [Bacteroidales bacterium]|nr:exodeoxyribonuclease III [Bacteroidales bacterium]
MMKFISWNVNGLRAVLGKGFTEIFESYDADFFCLQETKLSEGQLDLNFLGYQSYWNYADKKGYSGTAVFTRHTPLSVSYGIGIDEHDHEGRVITLEMEDFYLVNVYVPNSQDGLRRLDYRQRWEDDFRAYLCSLAAGRDGRPAKGVIVCGDMNVAHNEIDLKNPSTNHMNAGFSDEERAKMTALLGAGFTDTFRHFFPDAKDQYSWWSYRMAARSRNVGWRIDYFLTSNAGLGEAADLTGRLVSACIHQETMGSDHCPVELVIE